MRRPPVLLAHSYYLRYDPKQTRKMKPYPPLATILTASVLRLRGTSVALFDAMLSEGEEEFLEALDATRPRVVAILEDNFNFLTKMCTTRMREAALRMIADAKEAGCLVAVNGSDAADRPELYLGAGADAVIVGETERTLPELVALWETDARTPLDGVHGLVLPGPGGLRRTPPRLFVDDLNALPFPAWDLVDVERYRAAWMGAHGRLSWNVVTTRGCPYRCNWCAKPLYGSRYAQRTPANVAQELKELLSTVRPDHVWFADDIFGLTHRWIESFAIEVAARGARVPFAMQSRVDLMSESAVEALAGAGAEEVWLGVESGSQQVLDAMEKGTRVEQVRLATRRLRQEGIRAAWFLQLGYPGETWEEILGTRDLIREELPDDVGVSVAYPLPGTTFHDAVKTQLREQTNWEHSDDLAMMFEGTYTGAFYRRVRDLLHEEAEAAHHPEDAGRRGRLAEGWDELERTERSFRSARPSLSIRAAS